MLRILASNSTLAALFLSCVPVNLYVHLCSSNFLPGAGPLRYLKFPVDSNSVRIDTGVSQGNDKILWIP